VEPESSSSRAGVGRAVMTAEIDPGLLFRHAVGKY
jgi:hypothetical protein